MFCALCCVVLYVEDCKDDNDDTAIDMCFDDEEDFVDVLLPDDTNTATYIRSDNPLLAHTIPPLPDSPVDLHNKQKIGERHSLSLASSNKERKGSMSAVTFPRRHSLNPKSTKSNSLTNNLTSSPLTVALGKLVSQTFTAPVITTATTRPIRSSSCSTSPSRSPSAFRRQPAIVIEAPHDFRASLSSPEVVCPPRVTVTDLSACSRDGQQQQRTVSAPGIGAISQSGSTAGVNVCSLPQNDQPSLQGIVFVFF